MTVPPDTSPDASPALAAGVFDIDAAQCQVIVEAACAQGRCTRFIEAGGARDKHTLLARIADALEFPQWFGHNWDALADCLSDLSWLPRQSGYVFLLDDCSAHTEAMPVLREIFEQACSDWHRSGVTMSVFIVRPQVEA